MKALKKKLKIAVLDDSEFYNHLVTHQLKSYTDGISLDSDQEFEIESYSDADEFLKKLKPDTDLVYTDYYLGNGITGDHILREIQRRCTNCTVVIISQNRNTKTAVEPLSIGADKFIFKDKNTLARACFFLDDYLKGKYRA